MSKNGVKIINNESDIDDIDPSELIDTQENKPKATQHEDLAKDDNVNEIKKTESHYKKIEYKPVSKLTAEESNYLIDLYKNGGEDDYYKVYFYKNGTNKIVRKKQPPKYNTAKRLLEQQQQQAKPVMTTEQILMEHVIDLETKYATLYQKHKKLKKNYKALHEDIYCDSDDDRTITPTQTQQEKPTEEPTEENKAPQTEEPTEEPTEQPTEEQPQMMAQQEPQAYHEHNEFQNNYINRLRRPQKGYRKMMANMY